MWTEAQVLTLIADLDRADLQVWIEQGWVRPARDTSTCVYDEIDVARLRLICQLRRDLDIAEDMIPTVLSMIDQIYGLRRELRDLVQAIELQADDVRQNIVEHLRKARQELPFDPDMP